MERGDCIVILLHHPRSCPNEVANVISSTGQVLQVVRSGLCSRVEACSPDGEFMQMYGSPDPEDEYMINFSLTHMRSGAVVSELADRDLHMFGMNVWSQDSKLCTNLSGKSDDDSTRQVVHLHGAGSASETTCYFPKDHGEDQSNFANLSFSPFRQLLVEHVRVRPDPHPQESFQLVHWNFSQAGVPATFNTVSAGPDSPDGCFSDCLHVSELAWHPSPFLQAYAVCEGEQSSSSVQQKACSPELMACG